MSTLKIINGIATLSSELPNIPSLPTTVTTVTNAVGSVATAPLPRPPPEVSKVLNALPPFTSYIALALADKSDALSGLPSTSTQSAAVNSGAIGSSSATASQSTSAAQAAVASATTTQQATAPSTPTNETLVSPVQTFAPRSPASWLPIINGWQINQVQYKISDADAGNKTDVIAQLTFHYPQVRALGYELTQFTMELFAWNQQSYDELQQLLHSIYPPVYSKGNKLTPPKVSTIIYPGMNARDIHNFIPIKPTTSFLVYDQDRAGYSAKITFLQWNPVSVRQYPSYTTASGVPSVPQIGGNQPPSAHAPVLGS